MDIITEAVKRLENRIHGSGSEEGIVTIQTDPDRVICQYERGACLKATYGGRSAEFVTMDPVTAKTRIGFMFGAVLGTLPQRAAACAIMNVATGFFCLSRTLKACDPVAHRECRAALRKEIGGESMYPVGIDGNALAGFGNVVKSPEEAGVILVVGDGLIGPGAGDLLARYAGEKRIILLSPSTAGVSALLGCTHWCPFGKG
ncbi:MAG: hypothetical protein GKC05_05445 [Methanomicrobiales archaeon]|nr:hypothetical protein [Methanomicrobiales archaeon]NYT20991.1 hypothetical protein [Methanomicrobiales archaeon]